MIFIGFILRLIATLNLNVLADDMVYASQSAGIIKSKILSTAGNPPLFFYLTDLAYKFFGYTTFASRFFVLICGTLLIAVTFLLTKKMFNERVAIFAAFLVTFSSFLIRMTFTEQSLMVFFFSFLATYLGINYLENKKMPYLIACATIFGIAMITKYNAPFFVICFLLFSCFFLKNKNERLFSKDKIKAITIFVIIIFIFTLPIISFNYLLYKDKGIVDFYFNRIIGIEKATQIYSGLAGSQESFTSNIFDLSRYINYKLIFKTDLVILLFSVYGLFLWFKEKRRLQLSFFLIFLLIPFVLQSAGSPLSKHFAFIILLFAMPAGHGLNNALTKINKRKIKIIAFSILTLTMVINLGISYGTPSSYFYKSETSQLKSFINENVEKGDLIVFDSRIYTSQIFWLATPNHFLNLGQFPEFYEYNLQLRDNLKTKVKVYVIECVVDDCGWGWIKDNQEVNQSAEHLINIFKNSSEVIGSISSFTYNGNELFGDKIKTEKYRIYSLNLDLSPEVIEFTDMRQTFFFIPYLYKNMEGYFFEYNSKGFDLILEKLSLYIIYISMMISLITIILPIILLKLK